MPEIAPFRAVRYATRDAAALGKLIAPPYDVISPTERAQYAAREPHNVVHLILPRPDPGEERPEAKYELAGRTYRQWLAAGVLARDAQPAVYVLHQDFAWEGKRYLRRGFLARLRLRPFADGVVLPHERTLAGPKADRLNLFRQVKANLSPIFALVDDRGDLQNALEPAGDPEIAVRGDDGVDNLLWPVTDPTQVATVASRLAPRKAYIADGHHRYETGLAYARELDAAAGPGRRDGAHHSILAYFCGMSDPGLLILPTHRVLHGLAGFNPAALVAQAGAFFSVEKLGLPPSVEALQAKLAARGREGAAFALVAGHETWLLALEPGVDLARFAELSGHAAVRGLDVSVLHGLVFQKLLGLSPASQERQENLRYVKDARDALQAVTRGDAQASFLLNATRMEQVRAVADAGDVMPQKSTFFYPQLPSGLLFNPLDPQEPF